MSPREAFERLIQASRIRRRESQIRAAEIVARTLAAGRPLFFQGETGSGKTLAYLIGGLSVLVPRENPDLDFSDERPRLTLLVVSTMTKVLQEQIRKHDLRLAVEALGLDGEEVAERTAFIQGRGNYLCKKALEHLREEAAAAESEREREAFLRFVRSDTYRTLLASPEMGFFENLPRDLRTGRMEALVTAESVPLSLCLSCRKHCSFMRFVKRPLRKAAEGGWGLVITNHWMLLRIKFLVGMMSGIAPENTAYLFVVDEAHGLPRVLAEASTFVADERAEAVVRRARDRALEYRRRLTEVPRESILRRLQEDGITPEAFSEWLTTNLANLRQPEREAFFARLEALLGNRQLTEFFRPRSARRLLALYIRKGFSPATIDRMVRLLEALEAFVHELREVAERLPVEDEETRDPAVLIGRNRERNRAVESAVQRFFRRCARERLQRPDTLVHFIKDCLRTLPYEREFWSLWRFLTERLRGGEMLALLAEEGERFVCPTGEKRLAVQVPRAEHLSKEIFGENPRVYVSATLADRLHQARTREEALRTLAVFAESVGEARALPSARALHLTSTFPFAQAVLLYVADDLPDPRREEEWLPGAIERLRTLVTISRGGALVLFTNAGHMLAAYEALRNVPFLEVQTQEALPAAGRPDFLREAPNRVLLGLASLWQGFDVPGENLRLVVIFKLPFAEPRSPEALRDQFDYAKSALAAEPNARRAREKFRRVFWERQLPKACIAFRQMFGRLIRSETDRGAVAVLDPRLTGAPYGRRFLEAIPEVPRASGLSGLLEVARFFSSFACVRESTPAEVPPPAPGQGGLSLRA